MSYIKKAKRENIPLKLGVSGASGSGKSYSAILLAKGLMGGSLESTVVLDTENGSANLYAHLGDYSVMPLMAPYHPHRYIKAINYAVEQGFKCLIIDSISHEWNSEGGCLDIHSNIGGNSFAAWKKVTPLHNEFIRAILDAPINIICTMRRKQEYSMDKNEQGRTEITKMGLKEVQREDFSYELTANFSIDQRHYATVDKDRTELFNSSIPFRITEETGKLIREWNS